MGARGEAEDLLEPGWRIGEYVVRERISPPTDEGQVFRVEHRRIFERALKAVRADTFFKAVVEKEISLLSLVRHTHIVRITDFDARAPEAPNATLLTQPRPPVFYIVMDYVPGEPLDEAWKSADGPQLLTYFDHLLDAVEYLHDHGILHMDLKPTNVLVEKKGGNVVIIDLGFSLVASPDRFRERFGLQLDNATGQSDLRVPSLLGNDQVYVAFTEPYIRTERSGPRRMMAREELASWFPDHDLYAIGKMIAEALEATNLDDWPSIKVGLQLIWNRVEKRVYRNAADLRADLRKLSPEYVAPLGVPELSSVADSGTYIVLSTEAVQVTDRLRAVIEHPLFQRARLIPQLELMYLLYPDARQSRLPHQLLTFHLCRLALAHLLADVRFRLSVEPADIEGTLLFALLHDVGHFPLSHMFEDLRGQGGTDRVLTDEDLFEAVVRGEGNEAIRTVLKSDRRKPPSLVEVIRRHFRSATEDALWSIASCAISGAGPGKDVHRVLAGLVSSAVDADKIAYLVGDSRMTGVAYGQGVDVHGFLRSLRLPKGFELGRSEGGPATGPVIAIDGKGLAAAESIILARYWMVNRVYWHHMNRAVMAAFKFAIGELMNAGQLRFSDYLAKHFWSTEVQAMEDLSAKYNKLPGKRLNPLSGLERGGRSLYKRFITISELQDADLHQKLRDANWMHAADVAREALAEVCKSAELPGSVLVDVPKIPRDSIEPERIRVQRDPEAGEDVPEDRSLLEASLLLTKLHEEFVNEVKKSRRRCPARRRTSGGLLTHHATSLPRLTTSS